MLLGIVTPLTARAETGHLTNVIIHKIIMKNGMTDHLTTNDYKGQELDIEEYFGGSSKQVAGVAFRIYKEDDTGALGSQIMEDDKITGLNATTKYIAVEGNPFITESNGVTIPDLPEGIYTIVEDKQKSTYVGEDGEQLTDSKAIPVTIALPFTTQEGTSYLEELHLYPKNTETKPNTEKKFKDSTQAGIQAQMGDVISYVITSTIPAKSEYMTLTWSDQMEKGLTYNKDLAITLGDTPLVEGIDYEIVTSDRGFTVNLLTDGLNKVKNAAKADDVAITLEYSAILNEDAVISDPQKNTVTLVYSNSPSENRVPQKVTPGPDNEIVINKTWAEGMTPVDVNFDIVDAGTGKVVQTVTLIAGTETVTVTGLDANKEYYVIEQPVNLVAPEYADPATGQISITNKQATSTTTEPISVITYGKKFVKIDGKDSTKLSGAEFVIKNLEGKFLALKNPEQRAVEAAAYEQAQKDYNADPENEDLKKVRDAAYEAMTLEWTWVELQDEAYKLISNVDGAFEIMGLKTGSYVLVETKQPAGYALPTDPEVTFIVEEGAYDTLAVKAIPNTEITIPQTGGMGTVIFFATGIALMGLAAYGLKRRLSAE